METTIMQTQQEVIDIPVAIVRKLSVAARLQGKTLKSVIENLVVSGAEALENELQGHPSPGKDPWFDNPENMAIVKQGIKDAEDGNSRVFSLSELKDMCGV